MPPKKQGGKKDEKRVSVFQGIVVCEDFETDFYPLNLKRPRCLLPVANRPMLAYVLDHLIFQCKLQEIYLVYSNFGPQIQEFVRENYKVGNICKIEFKGSSEYRTLADIFRQFDQEKIIKENCFILCGGNVVSNINLRRVYDEHRRQLENNPNTCMTMIVSETQQTDPHRYFIAHDENRRILSFRPPELAQKPIYIEAGIFKAKIRSRVNLRTNLRSTGIAICSPSVPSVFSDPANLDLATMDDFVKQSLDDTHIGIGSNEIFFNVIKNDEYGDSITTFSKFEEITKAIFSRIASPYTPSYQFRARTLKPYAIKKKENYRGENVKSAPNVIVDRRSIIGHNVEIGSGSQITNSCIGDNCCIGENVIIKDSTISDNSRIANNSKITRSIIGPSVVIMANSVVPPLSVIGETSCLAVTDCDSRPIIISDIKKRLENGDDDDEFGDEFDDFENIRIENVPKHVSGASLFSWTFYQDTEDFDDDCVRVLDTDDYVENVNKIWNTGWKPVLQSDEDDTGSDTDVATESESEEEDYTEKFNREVNESITRCVNENLGSLDVCPEITGSRNAYEVEHTQIIYAVGRSMIELSNDNETFNISKFKQIATQLSALLENFLCPNEKPNTKMQLRLLDVLNENFSSIGSDSQKVLTTLYNMDALEGAVILHWHDKYQVNDGMRKNIKQFIEYLEQSDSESEESD